MLCQGPFRLYCLPNFYSKEGFFKGKQKQTCSSLSQWPITTRHVTGRASTNQKRTRQMIIQRSTRLQLTVINYSKAKNKTLEDDMEEYNIILRYILIMTYRIL